MLRCFYKHMLMVHWSIPYVSVFCCCFSSSRQKGLDPLPESCVFLFDCFNVSQTFRRGGDPPAHPPSKDICFWLFAVFVTCVSHHFLTSRVLIDENVWKTWKINENLWNPWNPYKYMKISENTWAPWKCMGYICFEKRRWVIFYILRI